VHRLLSWILIAAFTLSACASEAPAPVETDTETSESARMPEVLSSFKPGDRIEVWAKSGECFEATFVSYEASTLTVDKKTYKRSYQRDDHRHRDQMEYGIEEIARVRVPQKPGVLSFTSSTPLNIAIGVVLVAAVTAGIILGLSFHGL
jgi:hypothetical protein